jgi:hypothetical protein
VEFEDAIYHVCARARKKGGQSLLLTLWGFESAMAAMPTPLRIQEAWARRRVMSRGDRREAIFYTEAAWLTLFS